MHRKSNQKTAESITDFGTRQLNQQNFSRTVVLPKTALQNCGCNLDDKDLKVNVTLVQKDDEKFIKITPICNTIDDEDIDEEQDDIENDKDE